MKLDGNFKKNKVPSAVSSQIFFLVRIVILAGLVFLPSLSISARSSANKTIMLPFLSLLLEDSLDEKLWFITDINSPVLLAFSRRDGLMTINGTRDGRGVPQEITDLQFFVDYGTLEISNFKNNTITFTFKDLSGNSFSTSLPKEVTQSNKLIGKAESLFLDGCYDETTLPNPGQPDQIDGFITTQECANDSAIQSENDYQFTIEEENIGKTVSYQHGFLPSERLFINNGYFDSSYDISKYESQHMYKYSYLKSSSKYPFNPQWFDTCRAYEVVVQQVTNTIEIYKKFKAVKTFTSIRDVLRAKNVVESIIEKFKKIWDVSQAIIVFSKDWVLPGTDCNDARCTENGAWAKMTAEDLKHLLIYDIAITSNITPSKGKVVNRSGAYKNGQSILQEESLDFRPDLSSSIKNVNLLRNAGTVDIELDGTGFCNIRVITSSDNTELSATPSLDFTRLTATLPGSYLANAADFSIFIERQGGKRVDAARVVIWDQLPRVKADVNALYLDGCRFIPNGGGSSWRTCSVIGLCDTAASVPGACGEIQDATSASMSRNVTAEAGDKFCNDTQWSYTSSASSRANFTGKTHFMEVNVSKKGTKGSEFCGAQWNNSSASVRLENFVQIVKEGLTELPSDHKRLRLHFNVSDTLSVAEVSGWPSESKIALEHKGVVICQKSKFFDPVDDVTTEDGTFSTQSCVATTSFDNRNIARIDLLLEAHSTLSLGTSGAQATVQFTGVTFTDGSTPESKGYKVIYSSQANSP